MGGVPAGASHCGGDSDAVRRYAAGPAAAPWLERSARAVYKGLQRVRVTHGLKGCIQGASARPSHPRAEGLYTRGFSASESPTG
jgi:hypothetical protein